MANAAHQGGSGRSGTGARNKGGKTADLMEDIDLSWVHSSERFKQITRHKQILTINRRNAYEIEEYRKQETERYKEPLVAFEYKQNGQKYVVGPR